MVNGLLMLCGIDVAMRVDVWICNCMKSSRCLQLRVCVVLACVMLVAVFDAVCVVWSSNSVRCSCSLTSLWSVVPRFPVVFFGRKAENCNVPVCQCQKNGHFDFDNLQSVSDVLALS